MMKNRIYLHRLTEIISSNSFLFKNSRLIDYYEKIIDYETRQQNQQNQGRGTTKKYLFNAHWTC